MQAAVGPTILALALVLLAAPATADRAGGDVVWASQYGNPEGFGNYMVGLDVSPARDRVFVTGWNYHEDESTDIATLAYDGATGQEVWVRVFSASNSDQAQALAASPNGSRVFVVGSSDNGTDHDFVTIAYSAQGRQTCVRRFRAEPTSSEVATEVAVSSDSNRVFVAGEVSLGSGDTNYGTVAYDAISGSRLWVRSFNGAVDGFDLPTAIAVSQDGTRVYVTGYSFGGFGQSYDFMTVAYNAVTGATVGSARYNGEGNDWDTPKAIAVSPDSSQVYVTGGSPGATDTADFATVAYSADLSTELWIQRLDQGGSESSNDVTVSLDGSAIYVAGQSDAGATTVGYAAESGQQLWLESFSGGGGQFAALGPDDQTLVVVGSVAGGEGPSDLLVLAYDADTGVPLWDASYDAGSEEFANGLGIAPNGSRVYAGGPGGGDYLTVAFSSS